jgi:hypothetical protein
MNQKIEWKSNNSLLMNQKIVTNSELQEILVTYRARGALTNQNAYDSFIQEKKQNEHLCKDKNGKNLSGVESHHILPRCEGGSDEPGNLVSLFIKDHVIAHWLRWKELGTVNDKRAYDFRISDVEERVELRRQHVLEARAKDQKEGAGFYNSEFQSVQGQKGGKRGGSANTPAQFEQRQKLGRQQGPITGRANQKPTMIEFLKKSSIWAHSAKASAARQIGQYCKEKDRGPETFVIISPKTAFIEVVDVLNTVVPGSVRSPASLHKLVYGEKKQLYGWRIVKMLTRSEALMGLQEFLTQNPDVNLIYDEDALGFETFE